MARFKIELLTLKEYQNSAASYITTTISDFKGADKTNHCFTYEESFSEHKNSQKELSFKMSQKMFIDNNWEVNPFAAVLHIGSQLCLTDKTDRQHLLTIKEISYELQENNVAYTYNCQDSFSYQGARQNKNYEIANDSASEDFIGAKTVDYWAEKIRSECKIPYEYIKLTQKDKGKDFAPSSSDERYSKLFEPFVFSLSDSTANEALISLGEHCGLILYVYEKLTSKDNLVRLERKFWFVPEKNPEISGLVYNPYDSIKDFSLSFNGDNLTSVLNIKSKERADGELVTLFPPITPFFSQVFDTASVWDNPYYPGMYQDFCRGSYKNYVATEFSPEEENETVYDTGIENPCPFYDSVELDETASNIVQGSQISYDSKAYTFKVFLEGGVAKFSIITGIDSNGKPTYLKEKNVTASLHLHFFNSKITADDWHFAECADRTPWLENRLIDFSYFQKNKYLSGKQYQDITNVITNKLRKTNAKLLKYTSIYYNAIHSKTKALADIINAVDGLAASAESDVFYPYQTDGAAGDLTEFQSAYEASGFTLQEYNKKGMVDFDKVVSKYTNLYFNSSQNFLKNCYNFDRYFNATIDNNVIAQLNIKNYDITLKHSTENTYAIFSDDNDGMVMKPEEGEPDSSQTHYRLVSANTYKPICFATDLPDGTHLYQYKEGLNLAPAGKWSNKVCNYLKRQEGEETKYYRLPQEPEAADDTNPFDSFLYYIADYIFNNPEKFCTADFTPYKPLSVLSDGKYENASFPTVYQKNEKGAFVPAGAYAGEDNNQKYYGFRSKEAPVEWPVEDYYEFESSTDLPDHYLSEEKNEVSKFSELKKPALFTSSDSIAAHKAYENFVKEDGVWDSAIVVTYGLIDTDPIKEAELYYKDEGKVFLCNYKLIDTNINGDVEEKWSRDDKFLVLITGLTELQLKAWDNVIESGQEVEGVCASQVLSYAEVTGGTILDDPDKYKTGIFARHYFTDADLSSSLSTALTIEEIASLFSSGKICFYDKDNNKKDKKVTYTSFFDSILKGTETIYYDDRENASLELVTEEPKKGGIYYYGTESVNKEVTIIDRAYLTSDFISNPPFILYSYGSDPKLTFTTYQTHKPIYFTKVVVDKKDGVIKVSQIPIIKPVIIDLTESEIALTVFDNNGEEVDNKVELTITSTKFSEEGFGQMSNGAFWLKYHKEVEEGTLSEYAVVIETQLETYWHQAYIASKSCNYFLPEHWQPTYDQKKNYYTSSIIDTSKPTPQLIYDLLPKVEVFTPDNHKGYYLRYVSNNQSTIAEDNEVSVNECLINPAFSNFFRNELPVEFQNTNLWYATAYDDFSSYYTISEGGLNWSGAVQRFGGTSLSFDYFSGQYGMILSTLFNCYYNSPLAVYDDLVQEHDNIWYELYEAYPGVLLENDFSSETAIDEDSLYKEALAYMKDYNEPEKSYNISVIDLTKVGYWTKNANDTIRFVDYEEIPINIGDAIKIQAYDYHQDADELRSALEQYLFITDISYTLRDNLDMKLTVNNIKFQDKLIQSLAKLIY